MAVYDVYGKMPTRAAKLAQAFAKRIRWATAKNLTADDIARELKYKMDITYEWVEE